MEPQYRFCTSADGTRIAYATYGSGPPLLFANTWVLSMDAQFTWPEARAFFDTLAARATIITFDRRGTGASTREVEDISPVAEAADIAAVADAAGLETFPLFADATAGAACARYAGEHPDRVPRLVLWFLSTHNTGSERDLQMARAFREEDWSYNRRRWAGLVYHDGPVSMQRAFSRAVKVTMSPEMAARRFEEPADLDAILAGVGQPTLILQRDLRGPAREFTIRAAGFLQNGQLRFVPGLAASPYPGHEPIVDAAFEFFGIAAHDGAAAAQDLSSETAVILFADVVNSTALSEQMGDSLFRERSRLLEERVRKRITAHAGKPVAGRTLGDGVLATFASASDAIGAAMDCGTAGEDVGLGLHLGLHAGDVIREAGNVHGQAVSIASRVSELSAPDEVLVSGTVRDLARASAGVSFEDRGEHALKGVSEPVRVYAVSQNEQ